MTKIIIVDEHDNEIGLKERDEIEKGDIYRVSGIWITNSKGEILLSQRSLLKKKSPGKWTCAAAGTVDEGETYENNILKEVEEEIGITLLPSDLFLGPRIKLKGIHTHFSQ